VHPATGVAIAITFVWLGMVLAISFVETPLKFQAPGVDLRTGLGIGRLVFRALNGIEFVWAITVVICLLVQPPSWLATAGILAAIACLLVQVVAVRPALSRRTAAVLAGEEGPRSHGHYAYVVLETVKVAALLIGGIALLVG
jgi:hypothetical protein